MPLSGSPQGCSSNILTLGGREGGALGVWVHRMAQCVGAGVVAAWSVAVAVKVWRRCGPVEHGCGNHLVAQDVAPAADPSVGRQDDAGLEVALADDLEERRCGIRWDLHLDPRGVELLFQVITEREERASVACASSAPFSEWNQTFTNPRPAAANVDRLTFNDRIIQTGRDSYRLRSSRSAACDHRLGREDRVRGGLFEPPTSSSCPTRRGNARSLRGPVRTCSGVLRRRGH